MKNTFIVLTTTLLLFAVNSCESSKDIAPDPDGTITTNVTGTAYVTLYKGTNLDVSSWPCVLIHFNIDLPAGNIHFYTNATLTCGSEQTIYNWPNINGYEGAEASDIGKIDGLGDIIKKPSSGYSNQSSLIPGHGYVVRWRKSDTYVTSTQPYFYHRFFVTDYIVSTNGGVLGVTIKIQGPF